MYQAYRFKPGGLLVALAVATFHPSALHGQPEAESLTRRLAVVSSAYLTVSGVGSGLASQFQSTGFAGTTPSECGHVFLFFFDLGYQCWGGDTFPTEHDVGLGVDLTVRYNLRTNLAIGAGRWDTGLGGAEGYRSATDTRISSHWDASATWVAVLWRPHPELRVGGGPALYRLRETFMLRDAFTPAETASSRVGLVGEAGAEFPARSRVFLDLAVRGFLVPSVRTESRGSVPSFEMRGSHVAFAIGAGLRFF